MYILGKCTFYQRHFFSWTCFSNENGLFLANKLQEFVLTKSVCELIDFDFDAVLTNLGGSDFADIEKLVIQGMNSFSLFNHYYLTGLPGTKKYLISKVLSLNTVYLYFNTVVISILSKQ